MPSPLDGIVEQRRYLSFSQLQTYQNCAHKYELSYVQKVEREPQGAFLGGATVHKVIQASEQAGWWSDEDDAFLASDSPALAEWHRRFDVAVMEAGPALSDVAGWDERREMLDRLPEAERAQAIDGALPLIRWGGRQHGEDYSWWHRQGEFMLRRYRDTRVAMEQSGWAPVEGGVEMRVLAELEGVSVPVVGYLDKFVMRELDRETGEVGDPTIVDYKTGQVGRSDPFQFATYARLLERSRGIVVRRAIAVYLRAADAARRVAPVEFVGLLPHVDRTYGDLVRGVEAELFMPNPNPFCSSCSVRRSCWSWLGTNPEDA